MGRPGAAGGRLDGPERAGARGSPIATATGAAAAGAPRREASRLTAPSPLAQAFAAGTLPETFRRGLADASWPGRGQTVLDPPAPASDDGRPASASRGVLFFLDGAHTGESTELSARWFLEASAAAAAGASASAGGAGNGPDGTGATAGPSRDPERILLFNCLKARAGGDGRHYSAAKTRRG